jgi:hypothetical protein
VSSTVVMFGFKSLLAKHNPSLSAADTKSVLSAGWASMEHSSTEIPDFYTRTENDGEPRSVLASDLAMHIAFPASVQQTTPSYGPEQVARHNTIANELDTFVTTNVKSSSPLFKLTKSRLQKLMDHMVLSALMERRYGDWKDFFPPFEKPNPEGCSYSAGRRSIDILIDQENGIESVDSGSAIVGLSAQQIRLLKEGHVDASKNEVADMAQRFGFEPLRDRLRLLATSIHKVASINLSIFMDLYAGAGVVVGSGTLSVEEMNVSKARRLEWLSAVRDTERFSDYSYQL